MSSTSVDPRQRAWVEVDLDALTRNARCVAEHVAPARLLPMVKADAYGLGAVEVSRALLPLDPYALGVATSTEGAELRAAGISGRVIVFTPGVATDVPVLVANELDAAVLSEASLEPLLTAALESGGELGLHLEIDTGMGRAGLPWSDADAWAPRVAGLLAGASSTLASAYTHFHSAGSDAGSTGEQLGRLRTAVTALEAAGVDVPLVHAGNSDAVIRDEQYHLDLVRPGIYLYGGRRGASIDGPLPDPAGVVRVRARVLETRDLAPGSTVSYGATYTTSSRERVATLGIGYADGLPWRLSNRGEALVAGVRVPIRGGVCMDVTAVDVSGVRGVEPSTIATLIGEDGDEEITLGDVAETARTIEYEILTAMGGRLPRVYRAADTRAERST